MNFSFKKLSNLKINNKVYNLAYSPDSSNFLLKAGFTLTGNIETKTITGKELFSVSDGALLLCLEE